tara:strand:- start:357 stop:638 length:282 start_codon:yes stop_codon:yes gene_type:complete
MSFKDNLIKNKNGNFTLKSKSKKAKKGVCLTCGQDSETQGLLYEYKAKDFILIRQHMEDHLTTYSTHKSITPIFCKECKALLEYKVTLDNEKK